MKNKKITQIICIIVLISLLIGLSGPVLFKPKKTKAFLFPAVVPTAETPAGTIFTKEWLLDNLVKVAVRSAVELMVRDIAYWARTGFRGNQPFAVANWANYLRMAVDIGSARFIEIFELTELCLPFKDVLGRRLGLTGLYNYQPYQYYAACTIGTIVENVEEFFENPSISTYGWGAWTALSLPQNNIYGSFILATEKRAELESESREAKKTEATISGGYQNFTKCMESVTVQEGIAICIDEMLRTTGTEVHDLLEEATRSNLEWLISADEIGELFVAFIQGIWNRLIGGFYNIYDSHKDLKTELPDSRYDPSIEAPIPEIELPEIEWPEIPELPDPEDFWKEQFPEGPPWEELEE